jgi:peroxiredoxin
MRRVIFTAAILVVATQAFYAQEPRAGAPISDLTLSDASHQLVNYSALKGGVTVVMFFSTRCPMSNAFNYRRNTIYKDFASRVKFIVVDSNSNESAEEVQEYARAVEFDFPVYKDVNDAVADRFGAQVTTETFVIDSSDVVQYHGYIEDSPNPTRATKQGLRRAIEAVLEGNPAPVPKTTALGCTIRRVHR